MGGRRRPRRQPQETQEAEVSMDTLFNIAILLFV